MIGIASGHTPGLQNRGKITQEEQNHSEKKLILEILRILRGLLMRSLLQEKLSQKSKAGGVIMLGPIPIIFGSDKESAKTAAILAIILMLLSLLIFRGSLF